MRALGAVSRFAWARLVAAVTTLAVAGGNMYLLGASDGVIVVRRIDRDRAAAFDVLGDGR